MDGRKPNLWPEYIFDQRLPHLYRVTEYDANGRLVVDHGRMTYSLMGRLVARLRRDGRYVVSTPCS